ncbi:MAG: preprotein translocase subunit SecG [Candidatus Moraniibacteriota bacterium]|nr:MAG: preprotein translocase subunit SecG [Candidatus Moranbacteria bacterium]
MRASLIAQAVVAILLTVSILLQNRGSGLGSAFGSDFGGYYTKRGFERFLVYATIGLAVAFFVLAMINVRLSTVSSTGL